MKKKIFYWFCFTLVLLFLFWFFYLRKERENRLIKQGNEVVIKIEKFKNKTGRLPNSLSEIGILEYDENDLFFVKEDSIHYVISFGMTIDNSRYYFSDSKKWENTFRRME